MDRPEAGETESEFFVKSFGFGLERLGLVVLRFPRIVAVVLAISVAGCFAAIPNVSFDGNILNILSRHSDAFREYRTIQRDFRDFSGDLAVLVRADDLYSPEEFEKLRNFHLDLTLTDGVEGVYSLFSANRMDARNGKVSPIIPDTVSGGTDVAKLVRDAAGENRLVGELTRVDRDAALIELETSFAEFAGEGSDPEPVHRMLAEIRDLAPPEFTVDFAGFPLMRADAVDALITDQVKLSAIGVVMAALIAFLIFRSPLPALLCTAPALISMVWVLGGFGLSGIEISYLSTTLPTIAMVVALADAVMLYFVWAKKRAEGLRGREAVAAAVMRAGPANAMTSVTTAVAFSSFGLSGNEALRSLAILGASAVIIAFVAVMTVLPLFLLLIGGRIKTAGRKPFFAFAIRPIAQFAAWRPIIIAGASIVLAVVLSSGHFFGVEAHQITNHVPKHSEAAKGEKLTRDIFGGVAPIYLTVPVPKGESWSDPAALEYLRKAESVFERQVGQGNVLSLSQIAGEKMSAGDLRENLRHAPENVITRFLSHDRTTYLVTGTIPFGLAPASVLALANNIERDARAAGIRDTRVMGYPILAAIEIPAIVKALKASLIVAIVLGVCVLAAASRAPIIAFAALIPNLIPIFFMETTLWLAGRSLDIPHVVALTIAFGISIDNAIHIINVYLANRSEGQTPSNAIDGALGEVAPALISATLMFTAGTIGTTMSSLPSIVDLGYMIIATLAVALIANLAILPATILTLERLMVRRGYKLAGEQIK